MAFGLTIATERATALQARQTRFLLNETTSHSNI